MFDFELLRFWLYWLYCAIRKLVLDFLSIFYIINSQMYKDETPPPFYGCTYGMNLYSTIKSHGSITVFQSRMEDPTVHSTVSFHAASSSSSPSCCGLNPYIRNLRCLFDIRKFINTGLSDNDSTPMKLGNNQGTVYNDGHREIIRHARDVMMDIEKLYVMLVTSWWTSRNHTSCSWRHNRHQGIIRNARDVMTDIKKSYIMLVTSWMMDSISISIY